MKRRKFIAGLAAAAGGLSSGQLLAEQNTPSAVGAGSCRLITQDVTGPFHTERYPDRANETAVAPKVGLIRPGRRTFTS